jgi:hypothetical protein
MLDRMARRGEKSGHHVAEHRIVVGAQNAERLLGRDLIRQHGMNAADYPLAG